MDNVFLDLDAAIEDAQFRLNDALQHAHQLNSRGPSWPALEEFMENIEAAKVLLRIPEELDEAITGVEEELEHLSLNI